MRKALLAMSTSTFLREQATKRAFVRRSVSAFMPGEKLEDALGAAATLKPQRINTILTRLGEGVTKLDEAERVTQHYLDALDKVKAAGLDAQISVKPTQLGLDLDRELCLDHLIRLAERAAAAGSYLWIDMEGSDYTDATIELYEALRAVQPKTGICLQAYLRRTASDIARLRPLDPAIRLVKGAYDEPESIAFRNRRQVDANFVGLAVSFLLDGRGRPIRLGLGTHDVDLIQQIADGVKAAGIDRDGFEVEMLYGIRTDQQYRLAREGFRVQCLIAYGEYWYPWYMRRLAERPANVWFALRQMLP
jgi:proline dehydrogenase